MDIPSSKFYILLKTEVLWAPIVRYCRARLTLDLIALSSGVDMMEWCRNLDYTRPVERAKLQFVENVSGIYIWLREELRRKSALLSHFALMECVLDSYPSQRKPLRPFGNTHARRHNHQPQSPASATAQTVASVSVGPCVPPPAKRAHKNNLLPKIQPYYLQS